jgi:creatinine amidohydrolase
VLLPMTAKTEYRYNRLTWREMNDAIAMQKVVILPTGSTEQHAHLPLDTDTLLCESVCLEVGRRIPDKVLVLPPVAYGLNLHHVDFPGVIHIEPEVFIAYCLNITKSVAYHGFEKILIVNGHGSNMNLVDLVARKTVLSTHSLCAAMNYYSVIDNVYGEDAAAPVVRHACEIETSLYMYLAPERVHTEDMVDGSDLVGRYISSDSVSPYVRFNDYWGRWTTTGVNGSPSKASAEKGKLLFEHIAARMIEIVKEWRAWPIEDRKDQHVAPVQSQIQW